MLLKKTSAIRLPLFAALIISLSVCSVTTGCQATKQLPDNNSKDQLSQETTGTGLVIKEGDDAQQIATAIRDMIDSLDGQTTVFVSGSTSSELESLYINIPKGVTLCWAASCFGGGEDGFMLLDGEGTFELLEGGDIRSNALTLTVLESAENLKLVVNGGKVSCKIGVTLWVRGSNCQLVMNSGLVEMDGSDSYAIIMKTGELQINGGLVSFSGNVGYAIALEDCDLFIRDGEVRAEGLNCFGIGTSRGLTRIEGGRVIAIGECATTIEAYNKRLVICGGEVVAEGKDSLALDTVAESVAITGGIVRASGEGSKSVSLVLGFLAFLTGTIDGDIEVSSEDAAARGARPVYLMMMEIESLSVPAEWHRTTQGLNILAVYSTTAYWWDTSGDQPIIHIEYDYYDIYNNPQHGLVELVW
ncbi:MAG: hypothetical protein FWH40_08655 [Coriobacteriia bacterium]|nr:hypothetical protein [Coriobacteriia bacterium]